MRRPRRQLALCSILALALCASLGFAPGAQAKKAKPFSETKVVNAGIPEDPGAATSTALTSPIKVGKKYKGKVVGDVNVTGLQTTGSVGGANNDLIAALIAPNGRTIELFNTIPANNNATPSLGPWTIDDDTSTSICDQATGVICADATRSLYPPFAGTSNLLYNNGAFPTNGPLASFNGIKMRGTWTLSIVDVAAPGAGNGTSVLNQWGLRIKAAKPVED